MIKIDATSWGPTSEAIILAFEQQIGFSIPDDYRRFLLEYNGAGVDNNQVFFVKDLDQDVMLDKLFGITNPRARSLTPGYWLKEYGDEIPEKTLLFGCDPGGRFLMYVTEGEQKGVYYWDDTHFYPQSREEDGDTYFIADSFAEFYDSLMDYTPANRS